MKIGIVGCGALGSYYGAKLCRAGFEVHFLLRSDYEVVRRSGVQIQSPGEAIQVHPGCARVPEEIGPCDVVFIGLKTTANDQLSRLVPPLLGAATAVVTLQNGLGNEERLADVVGPERVLGGLCFVCLNRVAPGRIVHTAHGRVILGEYQRMPSPRTRALAELFHQAGVACQVTPNLEQAHWEKLVWNIPFNGLGVAGVVGFDALLAESAGAATARGPCLATDRLLGEARWAGLVRELMLEVVHAANALGFPVPESLAERQIADTRSMGAYRASTLVDFERGQPLEVESLFLEPWRRAQQAGVPTPRLAMLCRTLSALDPGRSNLWPATLPHASNATVSTCARRHS